MTRLAWIAALGILAACGGGGESGGWAGTIDTLASGRVVVTNPQTEVWDSTRRWRVVEELRIGSDEGNGPDVFGRLRALATDPAGRIWALEAQDQVIKVFSRDGEFVRSIGRRGGGPGEFANAAGIAGLPDGRMLVIDHSNARISWFDTTGAFQSSVPLSGGFQVLPWPGRVDRDGALHDVAPSRSGGGFGLALVRYDASLAPVDTIVPPRWQRETNSFDLATSGGGRMSVTVPYSPGLQWRLAPDGTIWFVHTGTYELYQIARNGDTTRMVTKPFSAVPVTSADKDSAVARLAWFTNQGGKVDRGRIPETKPAVQDFLVADDGYLWVQSFLADTAQNGRQFDIFDPEGRFLGAVHLPFRLNLSPRPLIRSDGLIAVTENENGIPFLVRARIER